MTNQQADLDRTQLLVPETQVLTVASHLTEILALKVAYGFVGNTMTTFVMQILGCEVAAINTVHYSNHAAYRQLTGSKTPASEILELYNGMKKSYLTAGFDMMLSGYVPTAEGLQSIGEIAKDLKKGRPNFFWALDPVMGDQGRLYVSAEELPIYQSLLFHADLILPNQFELELLSGQAATSLPTIISAIRTLHQTYKIPHIIVTSLALDSDKPDQMSVIGSTRQRDRNGECHPRIFRITIPSLPCFFSGTGDMFAALMVGRFREAIADENIMNSSTTGVVGGISDSKHEDNNLFNVTGWISPDSVKSVDLPLAKAAEKVLASMQAVLGKTYTSMQQELARTAALPSSPSEASEAASASITAGPNPLDPHDLHLLKTRASEVRVVRNVADLLMPPNVERFRAIEVSGDGL